jgi:hypothetical protein
MLVNGLRSQLRLARARTGAYAKTRVNSNYVFKAWLSYGASTNREAFVDASPEKGVKYLFLNRPQSKNAISTRLLKVCANRRDDESAF